MPVRCLTDPVHQNIVRKTDGEESDIAGDDAIAPLLGLTPTHGRYL